MTKQEKYLIEETLNSFDFDKALEICKVVHVRYMCSNGDGNLPSEPNFKFYTTKEELIENLRYIVTGVVSEYFGHMPREEKHVFIDGFDVQLYETRAAKYGANINVKFVPICSNTERF